MCLNVTFNVIKSLVHLENCSTFADMKVTSATIRFVLKKNKVNKNGESPINLVVCFHGRHEKSTGVSVKEKYWDARREIIRSGCPNAPVLNKMLSDIKQRVTEAKNAFEYAGKRYTPQMLLENSTIELSAKDTDYWNLCQKLMTERRLKDGTIRRYTYCYRKLCEFLGRKSFVVDELTLGVVKDFASWLEKGGIKINTIKGLLGCLAAAWNYAISRKLVDSSGYPFKLFKYTSIYHEVPRDYYLEKSHIVRLRDYWLDLCLNRNGRAWSYKDGVYERLRNRCSAEFGILWFLMMYKCNGSSPVDVALIRPQDCKRVMINGEDYWSIDIRRRKTSRAVHIRFKRDLLIIAGFEHFLGSSGQYVYPIINTWEGQTERQLMEQSHHASCSAIKHVRKAFEMINLDIARENVEKGLREPVVEPQRVVMYTARHSLAQQYLGSPGATVSGLASLMARSANTIATYVKQLTRDEDIAEMVDVLPI